MRCLRSGRGDKFWNLNTSLVTLAANMADSWVCERASTVAESGTGMLGGSHADKPGMS